MPYLPVLFAKPDWLAKYRIIRINGRAIEACPGVEGSGLDDVEEKIHAELLERRNLAGDRRRTDDGLTPMEWLRATLYGVILAWLAYEDGEEELFNRIKPARRYLRAGRRKGATVFHDGIVAVLADHSQVVTPTERDRMARPMWYAFRHYVQPTFLLGFNHQYPAHLTRDVVKSPAIDERLVDWVVEQRCRSMVRACPLEGYRGTYPDEIEEMVGAVVSDTLSELERARRASIGQPVAEADEDWPD